MNAIAYMTGQAWAIQPEALHDLMAIMAREETNVELARAIREDRAARFDAVMTKAGTKIDGTRTARQRNGVAVIPVQGPISRYASFFADVSGGATIDTLAADFAAAMADPAIKAIVLDINSPGGEITGVAAFAAQVAAARGVKPVTAYVDGLGASAAYWIASAADQVVLDSTAIVGSIGVVQAVPNPAATTARSIEIVSSQSPNKRPDVATEGGRATIQATVDALADLFIADVATYRGVSTEIVVKQFGRGGVVVGQQAVNVGMADRIGSIESVISQLASGAPRPVAGATPRGDAMDWKNVFSGLFAAAKEAEASEPLVPTVTLDTAAANDAEVARLKAQIEAQAAEAAKAKAAALDTAAVAFAEEHIAAGRFAPAQAAALEGLYKQVAAADGGVAQLQSLVAAVPSTLTAGEQIAPTPLPLNRGDDSEDRTRKQAAAQVAAYTGKK